MAMKIDDVEYHTRMLFDIAQRNDMTMLLHGLPNRGSGESIRAANGSGKDIIMLLGMICADIVSKTTQKADLDNFLNAVNAAARLAYITRGVEDEG